MLDSSDSSLRQSSAKIIEVPFNETSVNITDLYPQLMYNLTVSLVVVNETGQLLEGPRSLFLISNISTFSTKGLILDHAL